MASRETIQERIDIMQAWLDGKVIQKWYGGHWDQVVTPSPSFTFNADKYRIKPEPREIWVNEYESDGYAYPEKDMAKRAAASHAIREAVLYREVIEDETR